MGLLIEKNIQRLIDEKGWTLYRLSKESGVSLTTLYSLGAKKNGPSADALVSIADALAVTVDEIVREKAVK